MEFVDVDIDALKKRTKVKPRAVSPKGRNISTFGAGVRDLGNMTREWAERSKEYTDRIGQTEPSFED